MKWFYLLHAVKVRYDANIRCVFVCVSIATGLKCFKMRALCKYEPIRIGGDESHFFFFYCRWHFVIPQIYEHQQPFQLSAVSPPFTIMVSCSFTSYPNVALFRSNIYIFSPLMFFFSVSFPLSQITDESLSLLIKKETTFFHDYKMLFL